MNISLKRELLFVWHNDFCHSLQKIINKVWKGIYKMDRIDQKLTPHKIKFSMAGYKELSNAEFYVYQKLRDTLSATGKFW